MGNCSCIQGIDHIQQQPQSKALIATPPSVAIGEIFNTTTCILKTISGQFYYYIQGRHIKYIECPFANWQGVTSFGHTLGCVEDEEPISFAIICFNKELTSYTDFFTSYLGHCICKYCENLEIHQNLDFFDVPVKTISEKIRTLSNVYVHYLDTNIRNKSNEVVGVGSTLINILQTSEYLQDIFKYSYIHINSVPNAYTFYIQNKF
jgi:hypothetical protein